MWFKVLVLAAVAFFAAMCCIPDIKSDDNLKTKIREIDAKSNYYHNYIFMYYKIS